MARLAYQMNSTKGKARKRTLTQVIDLMEQKCNHPLRVRSVVYDDIKEAGPSVDYDKPIEARLASANWCI